MTRDTPGDRKDRNSAESVTAGEYSSLDQQARPSFEGSRYPPESRQELLDYARAYARTLDLDVDHDAIEWEISERAKRRAGACWYDPESETVTIRLTWGAYRQHGWEEMVRTIRHELVHAWEFQHFGDAGHGPRFRERADELDAPRYCRAFTRARLRLVCRSEDCDWSAERHRASKTVTHPERRRCGSCGDEYEVRHVESGETWTSNDGYRAAKERIGDEW